MHKGSLLLKGQSQLQEAPLNAQEQPTGCIRWQDILQFNLPFLPTVLAADAQAVLLVELLQHPQSLRDWQLNKIQFCGSAVRVGWSFLDLGHPDVHHSLHRAYNEGTEGVLQLQVYECALVAHLPTGMSAIRLCWSRPHVSRTPAHHSLDALTWQGNCSLGAGKVISPLHDFRMCVLWHAHHVAWCRWPKIREQHAESPCATAVYDAYKQLQAAADSAAACPALRPAIPRIHKLEAALQLALSPVPAPVPPWSIPRGRGPWRAPWPERRPGWPV